LGEVRRAGPESNAVRGAGPVRDAVRGAGTVRNAVRGAGTVRNAVSDAVRGAGVARDVVRGPGAMRDAVRGAGAMRDAVRGAGAVRGEKKTDLLFTGMPMNVNITVHVDIQFPTKKFSVKTVDCMFFMQIPVKLKHQSLCSFCNVNNSQYFEPWWTLTACTL